MKSLTYLMVDLGCILIPFIASFYPKHSFYKEWKYFFPANIMVAFLFLIWDYYFTEAGFWGFNPDYLTGIYVTNLPLEEILFFICIPYACVFTYFALKYLIKENPLQQYHTQISIFLITTLTIIGIASIGKWYTALTFLLTATYVLSLLLRKVDLSYHYLAYFTILPFFFLSNGLLTGSAIEEAIVWYNDAENLGIRLKTIPVEDSIYGLLLILLNIDLYDFFRRPTSASTPNAQPPHPRTWAKNRLR